MFRIEAVRRIIKKFQPNAFMASYLIAVNQIVQITLMIPFDFIDGLPLYFSNN